MADPLILVTGATETVGLEVAEPMIAAVGLSNASR
jgi:hypothetical protein